MKKRGLLFFMVLTGLVLFLGNSASENLADIKEVNFKKNKPNIKVGMSLKPEIKFGKIPLYFITNQGQVNQKTKFYARASRYTLWLTKGGLVFDSFKKIKRDPCERDVSRMIFVNANQNPEMVPREPAAYRVNYFKGKDKSEWHNNVPTCKAVLYSNLYGHIDLKVYGIEKEIEYDWVVHPGGDPDDIRFEYKDVKSTHLDENGNLVIKTPFGELIHKKPVAFQVINKVEEKADVEKKVRVEVKFKKITENIFGFEVDAYDKNKILVIDPLVLVYSTYLGGTDFEVGLGTTVDSSGCAYVTGYTESDNFPTESPYQGSINGDSDAFVSKFSADGSSLIYSTYLGGSDYECGIGIAVDNLDCAYVIGMTSSDDFPTENPFQPTYGLYHDAFVTKISADGSTLVYSTYLGGSGGNDWAKDIALDSLGCAYVSGSTTSDDFPLENPFQGSHGGGLWDGFASKFSADGSSLIYSTYLGGSEEDGCHGIALDSLGCAYVTGYTESDNFPTESPYQGSINGDSDAFVTRFSADGSSLVYSSYLGGSNGEDGDDIALDSLDCFYIIGDTNSNDFPTQSPIQGSFGGGDMDAFVTKFSADGSSLVYSTYLGGSDEDNGDGIALDGSDCVYVFGHTQSDNFPTERPFQEIIEGNRDFFVSKFAEDGSSLIYSTYLGGSGTEGSSTFITVYGSKIAVDSLGCAYVTGHTDSGDFPIENPFQENLGGGDDAFLCKLNFIFEADLAVQKVVDNENPHVGDTIIFNITVINNGPDDASGVVVQDVLPAELDFVSATPSTGTYNPFTGNWDIGNLANGNSATLELSVQVNSGGSIENTASISALNENDPENENDSDSAIISANYLVTASVSGGGGSVSPVSQSVVPGGSISITITPDEGYEISSIFDNSVEQPITNPYVLTDINENHEVVVAFGLKTYTINTTVSGGNGSVDPVNQIVQYGYNATIIITLGTGFHIASIADNGKFKSISNPYMIHNVRENHEVVVTFAPDLYAPMILLNAVRKTERAWIIRKDYAEVGITISEHPAYPIPVSKYILYRLDNDSWIQISQYSSAGVYTFIDKFLEKGKPFSYKMSALDSNGAIVSESNVATI